MNVFPATRRLHAVAIPILVLLTPLMSPCVRATQAVADGVSTGVTETRESLTTLQTGDTEAVEGWFRINPSASRPGSRQRPGRMAGDDVRSDSGGQASGRPVGAATPDVATESAERVARPTRRPSTSSRQSDTRIETENVDLFHGEIKVFGEVDVTRVAVGNGQIVRAEVLDSNELLVIAESPGSTSLRLWHQDGSQSDFNIRVTEDDPETRFHVDRSVRMRVRMVEFRKSALTQLGIDWSDSIAGPQLATAGDLVGNNLFRPAGDMVADNLPNAVQPFASYAGLASSITSRINLLASTGDATTLAEPVLHCANGESASFLAGGEVPYPSTGENGQTVVQFKEYGIRLNISPRIDGSGNVQTLIDTEISQLDPAVSIQGTPGLLTRRVQTAVHVQSGETIVISGLLSSENSRDADFLPGLGRLPIIGTFFRSRNDRRSVTELVVFVTPEIIEPAALASSGGDDEIQSWIQRERSSARQLLGKSR